MNTEPVVLEMLLARHKRDFFKYERVRQSGATNMFDVAAVSALGEIPIAFVRLIQKKYSSFSDRFLAEYDRLPKPTTRKVIRTIVVEEKL